MAPPNPGWAGAARLGLRLAAIVVVLLGSVGLFYAWRLAGLPNPWPRRFLAATAWLAGARVRVAGTPVRRGALLLSNHVSWLDILVLAGASGTAFVAHSGLAESRLLKWLCDMNDTVFIARAQRGTIGAQARQVREALDHDRPLAIFPEGTTSDGTGLLAFKSALLAAIEPAPPGVVVQPVLLDYGAQGPEIAWIGNEPGLANFKRILARRGTIALTAHFLEPFDPAAMGSRKAITGAARRRMLARLAKR